MIKRHHRWLVLPLLVLLPDACSNESDADAADPADAGSADAKQVGPGKFPDGGTAQSDAAVQPGDASVSDPDAGAEEFPLIPSNFDINQWINGTIGVNVPAYGGDKEPGAFRFICNASHHLYDDPIDYPGQPGKAPLFMFFGNTMSDASSTYQSLRTTGDGTCQGGPLNRSAYFFPAMMNGSGKVVVPDWMSIYYKAQPGTAQMFPKGLRFRFGFDPNAVVDQNHPRPYSWICEKTTSWGTHPTMEGAPCVAGDHIIIRLGAPDCWNGELDSPDHRSHLAYSYYNGQQADAVCPAGYPLKIVSFTVAASYASPGPAELAKWYLSTDREPGKPQYPAGTAVTSGWFGAWDDSIVAVWWKNCIEKRLNCAGGQLGDGRTMVQPPTFKWSANPQLIDPPPTP